MLEWIQIWDYQDTTTTFPLRNSSSGVVVQNIEGLDPVKASLVSSTFAKKDGGFFQHARRETRNIVITFGLEQVGVMAVREIRNNLYNLLMPKTKVRIRFRMTDGFSAYIDGYVESLESPMFSKEPSLILSLLCYDPDFVSPNYVNVEGLVRSTADEDTFFNPGTTESWLQFSIPIPRTLAGFTLRVKNPKSPQRFMTVTHDLVAGDIVTIGSSPGNKYLTLKRGGVSRSILYAMDPTSTWPTFSAGDNQVQIKVPAGGTFPYAIEYLPRYGGL